MTTTFFLRRELAAQHATLNGIHAGQPQRATAHPTAERLLFTFKEITLLIRDQHGHFSSYVLYFPFRRGPFPPNQCCNCRTMPILSAPCLKVHI